MKRMIRSCDDKSKKKRFSPGLAEKREPIHESCRRDKFDGIHYNDDDVYSSDDIDTFLDKIKSKVTTSVRKYAQSEGFEDDWDKYFFVDVYPEGDKVRVEVRAELSFDGMVDLADVLNPVIDKYDSDAYFDFDEPGIMTAFISTEGYVGSSNLTDADTIEGSAELTHSEFVSLLKEHFEFSEDAANIVARWYIQEDALDDFDDIDELLDYIEDDIYDMLDACTDEEEYDTVSRYLNASTDNINVSEDEFDNRYNQTFGEPSTEVFTPDEFDSWMKEVIQFE